MSRVIALLALIVASVFGQGEAQASPSAYTWITASTYEGIASPLILVCHNGTRPYLSPGDNSTQKCGGNGWVDKVCPVLSDQVIKVRNNNTGNVTTYYSNGCSTVGGGSYTSSVWQERPV